MKWYKFIIFFLRWIKNRLKVASRTFPKRSSHAPTTLAKVSRPTWHSPACHHHHQQTTTTTPTVTLKIHKAWPQLRSQPMVVNQPKESKSKSKTRTTAIVSSTCRISRRSNSNKPPRSDFRSSLVWIKPNESLARARIRWAINSTHRRSSSCIRMCSSRVCRRRPRPIVSACIRRRAAMAATNSTRVRDFSSTSTRSISNVRPNRVGSMTASIEILKTCYGNFRNDKYQQIFIQIINYKLKHLKIYI